MTLRSRLIAGIVAIVATLTACGVIIQSVQEDHLVDRLDRTLEAFVENAERTQVPLPAVPTLDTPRNLVTDAYLGARLPDGSLRTLVTPIDDPDLQPNLSELDGTGPATVGSTSGESDRLRARSVELRGVTLVVAIPMDDVDSTVRSLTVTLLLGGAAVIFVSGLFAWWMIRHGVRPIREISDAAEAITHGVTERRVAESPGKTEAARLARSFNSMVDTTQAAEAQQRRFVADVSHELRTPLTTLRGYADLHERGSLPDDVAVDDAMRRIRAEAGRMQGIVDQLLVLADLDEAPSPSAGAVPISPVLHDLASDIAVVQPDRTVTVDADIDAVAHVDAHQLVQALTVFTSNALRHTERETPLELVARHGDDGDIRISVVDHGPGVDVADRPHVFERFYRADVGRSRETGGSGLGLAIAAAIAAASGGSCGVEPTPGGGATFWIQLPDGQSGRTIS